MRDYQVSCSHTPMGFATSFLQRRFRPEPSPLHDDTSIAFIGTACENVAPSRHHRAANFAAPPRQRLPLLKCRAILVHMMALTSTGQPNSVQSSSLHGSAYVPLSSLPSRALLPSNHTQRNCQDQRKHHQPSRYCALARLLRCVRLRNTSQPTPDQIRDLHIRHLLQSRREHSKTSFSTLQREQAKLRKEPALLTCRRCVSQGVACVLASFTLV